MVDRMDRHYGTRSVSRRTARILGTAGARRAPASNRSAASKLGRLIRLVRMRWAQLQRGFGLINPLLRHAQGLAAVGLLVIQLVMSASTLWIDHAMAQHQAAVAAEVTRIAGDRERLAIAVAQASDPAYMVVRARDVLHYAQPDEHLVILANTAPLSDTVAPPWWFYE